MLRAPNLTQGGFKAKGTQNRDHVSFIDDGHYESGEVSRNGHISKHGNGMTRKHLDEAATTLCTRTKSFSALEALGAPGWPKSLDSGRRAAVARKLAVSLHAMWKTNTEFRWSR